MLLLLYCKVSGLQAKRLNRALTVYRLCRIVIFSSQDRINQMDSAIRFDPEKYYYGRVNSELPGHNTINTAAFKFSSAPLPDTAV
jgi:hypothetical protein